jgi:hypothetical protein
MEDELFDKVDESLFKSSLKKQQDHDNLMRNDSFG